MLPTGCVTWPTWVELRTHTACCRSTQAERPRGHCQMKIDEIELTEGSWFLRLRPPTIRSLHLWAGYWHPGIMATGIKGTRVSKSSGGHRWLITLEWRYNGRDGVSNHQSHDCLFSRFFRRRSKKTPELHFTGLCEGKTPVPDEFPAQMASNAENVSIWWRHHVLASLYNK